MKIECNITPEQDKANYEETKEVIEKIPWTDQAVAEFIAESKKNKTEKA